MPVDIDTWRQRIGKFNCIIFLLRSATCASEIYPINFLIYMLHVITDSLTFKILSGILVLFFYCVVILLALGITLCFHCVLTTYDYHFLGSASLSSASKDVCIRLLSIPFILARSPNIIFVKKNAFIKNTHFKLRTILAFLISSGSVETNLGLILINKTNYRLLCGIWTV